MGGLQRPQVPPGAQRDLIDALHDLHHRAGWPSLRLLARQAGCSHTTVAAVFSSPRLPSWGVLELVVEAMDGDVAEFHRRWLDAGAPTGPAGRGPLRLAGRRDELAAVLHHLESGRGLLLVVGEAGIGKTRLVDVASSASEVFVARGSGLPLSVQVPLLPVIDTMRAVHRVDDGQWLKEGLADCPAYVRGVLRRLLPELDDAAGAPVPADDDMWRQRLFPAVASAWAALAASRPLAVLVEDLHWADSTTLDLLEHLAATGPDFPLVATWRHDDPSIPPVTREWWTRIRRLSHVDELALRPLTRDETAVQLELVTGEPPPPATADRIYRRTAGHPLFTEHLAGQAGTGEELPVLLADLLDRRIDGLSDPAWRIARALAVADRRLPDSVLGDVTSLPPDRLADGLHALADRRLLHTGPDGEVQLRHPLLAEAVRRRLVRPELSETHRRIALVLARSGAEDAEDAEVAEHWRLAGDRAAELRCRIRAAHAAGQRCAAAQEAEQWLRVIELWPDVALPQDDLPVTEAGAWLAAVEALKASLQINRAAELIDAARAHLADAPTEDRVALLALAADFRGAHDSPRSGLELVQEALALCDPDQPTVGYVQVLRRQHNMLVMLGRTREARNAATTAARAAADIGDVRLHRALLALVAWHESEAGDPARGLQIISAARAAAPDGNDLTGDVRVSVLHTDILLRTGGSVEALEAAAAPGLEAARSIGTETWQSLLVRSNLSEGLTRAGFVDRAAELIDPVTQDSFDRDRWPVHLERATLDALRGRQAAAEARFADLRSDPGSVLHHAGLMEARPDLVRGIARVDLWGDAPDRALGTLLPFLDEVAGTDAVADTGQTFVLAARAAADVIESAPDPGPVRTSLVGTLGDLRGRAPVDLFTSTGRVDGTADAASWRAETARVAGRSSLRLWAAAAEEWYKITRPHDAAYCRWRGAQAALVAGQGTIAVRLLRRAARDAGAHVPLTTAIAATAVRTHPTAPPG